MSFPTGSTFVRTVKALGVARGDAVGAMAYASSQNWGNAHEIVASIKAAVTAERTSDYLLPTPAQSDFAAFIRPQTILGKLIGLRRVPSRVRVIAATSGSTAFWSGEAAPRPMSRMTFSGSTLEPLSIVAMLVTTAELLRSSSPSAESILSRDLAAAAVQAADETFIDPANAGIAGVKPAAITNGVTAIHSAGSTLANLDSDLALLIEALSDAGSDLSFATFVMRPRTALWLSGLRGSGGTLAYPGMGVKGGTLLGLPAIVSAAVPSSVGSPAEGGNITLLDPSQVEYLDEGAGAIEVSEHGSVQMSDVPGSGATTLTSLWQTDSACLKTTRYLGWQAVRSGMAQLVDQVAY